MLDYLKGLAHDLDQYLTAIGYVLLAIIGGVVAHIREWERLDPNYSLQDHLWSLFRRAVMAVLAGLIWYFLMLEIGWNGKPLAYVGASVVGLFSPEFFDMIWRMMKSRMEARTASNEQQSEKP